MNVKVVPDREVGTVRLYAMRIVFLLTFIGLAPSAWEQVLSPSEVLLPFDGVAISFWAALSLLAVMGVFYPLRMLPLLLLQVLYKAVWLLSIGLPLWLQGPLEDSARELIFANAFGVVLDVLVIPWLYVARNYFDKPVW
jgi:hypothetical protein